MEGLTRLVAESLARHGFDRPLDYRRLHWSRWFRCESPHSLLFVPSKPGVFAIAEEIMDLDSSTTHVAADAFVRQAHVAADAFVRQAHVVADAFVRQAEPTSAVPEASPGTPATESPKPEAQSRRMLAVTQFFEADDMAFVLDRMLSRHNPMQARLLTGHYFVRFVVIEDSPQRRSICGALNQWMISTAEKATGIGSHFASSLELTPATEFVPPADDPQATLFDHSVAAQITHSTSHEIVADQIQPAAPDVKPAASCLTAPQLDSGAATNIHCPSPFPSGF